MESQQDDGIFLRIQKSVASGMWLAHVPWFWRLHNFLMPVIGNHLAINNREGTIRDYTMREVQSRMERGSDRPDILGKLFEIHQEKPKEMDMTNICSVANENIGAGSDTTAISLRAMLYFLLTHPDKKANLLEEIDQVASSKDVLNIFAFDHAREMPYLQAVMYESMRLYPAIGNSLPRTTPPEGLQIGERYLPSGVRTSNYFQCVIFITDQNFTDRCRGECLGVAPEQADIWRRCRDLSARTLARERQRRPA